ncbi:hypothetical protein ACFZCU_39215 [Streptomyces canus]|uniref:hypothetical protein n=1 Tax=Streptomyces canus TaxID=58343 RepID=UPI0036E05784
MSYYDTDNSAYFQSNTDSNTSVTPYSAYGWTYFGGTTTVGGYDIPNGQLYGQVVGSGLTVQNAGGDFFTYHSMCEWNIDQVWYDSTGHKYRTDRTSTHNNCTGYEAPNTSIPAAPTCSRARVALFCTSSGVRSASTRYATPSTADV